MSKKTDDIIYVTIASPPALRRSILETSKLIVHGLQIYERIKYSRRQKQETASQMKQLLKDINSLIDQLEKILPKVAVKKPKIEAAKKVEKQIPDKNINQLESELDIIENKLKSLG